VTVDTGILYKSCVVQQTLSLRQLFKANPTDYTAAE